MSQFATGRVVAPEPDRVEHDELAEHAGERRLQLAGEHPAERAADEIGAEQSERGERLLLEEHELPEVADLVDRVGVLGGRPGDERRVDGPLRGELLQERIPREAGRRVQEDERGSAAAHLHAHVHPAVADGDDLLAHLRDGRHHATAFAGTPVGHQRCS